MLEKPWSLPHRGPIDILLYLVPGSPHDNDLQAPCTCPLGVLFVVKVLSYALQAHKCGTPVMEERK